MFRVTRRYEFAASHRLHAAELSEEENRRLYGKCNNPYGHGHNYVVEVSVRGPLEGATGRAVDTAALDELVRREVVLPFDHKNLNREVKRNWKQVFPGEWPKLDRIRIGETARNIFEVGSDEIE